MLECFAAEIKQWATPLIPVQRKTFDDWLARQSAERRNWLTNTDFKIAGEAPCLIPGSSGLLAATLIGVDSEEDLWSFGALTRLPPGDYRLEADLSPEQRAHAALGWGLGAYRFQCYKQLNQPVPRLILDKGAASDLAHAKVEAVYLVRDLINTPAADMMPEHMAAAATRVAEGFGAQLQEIVGDDLLTRGYPAIHAVGRASAHAPRLIDITWGRPEHPKLTLVGKGVCFDSGGLDLKPASGMRLMKKDMGGAAHMLGLAQLIMRSKLPVRLRVLIPAVENAVAGNAFRPGDVLNSRKGLTIEIDNTDAEGRLVLCDALAEAASEDPALILDFATLTGAARIALGTELPGFFTDSEPIANALTAAAARARSSLAATVACAIPPATRQ